MASAFAWLNNLISSFSMLFPRIFLVRVTHRGILFDRKGSARVIEPGLRMYWPIAAHLRLIPVITRSWEINRCVVDSELNREWIVPVPYATTVGAIVHANIVDVLKVIEVFSIRAYVETVCKDALCRHWFGTNGDRYRKRVFDDVSSQLQKVGIRVSKFSVIDVYTNANIGGANDLYGSSDWSSSDDSSDQGQGMGAVPR